MAIKIDWTVFPGRDKRKAFTDRLIPDSPLKSSGVSIPQARKIASALSLDDEIEFEYIEDVIVRGIIIFSARISFEEKKELIEAFLPFLCSWMVTDIVSSSLWYRKNEGEAVFSYFFSLIDRKEEMTRRLGIVALMDRSFMDEEHISMMLDKISEIHTDHYLLNMGAAWYFASAYTRLPDLAYAWYPRLDDTVRKMARQKCRDSRRISQQDKQRLG